MESIMSKKITHLAETHRLLPDTQMGARRGRSTETVLELLTEQIHTVWGQGNDKITTLLSMDVAGAYDTVSHRCLIHNLRKRKSQNGLQSDRVIRNSKIVASRFLIRRGF